MRKQTKRFSKIISTMALALVMSAHGAIAAFAAGEITGTETAPAKAAITKMFNMPEGTNTPAADFKFKFEKKSYLGNTDAASLAQMPAIADATASFTSADAGTVNNGLKSVPKEVIVDPVFTNTGIYTYEITETPDTYTIANPDNEAMTYSQAKYEITYYVKEKSDGSGYYVSSIVAKIITNDDGTAGSGDKVDPTPGGNGGSGDYSKLMFTNTYLKNNGGVDPLDPDNQVLGISKTVAGDYADTTKYFSYDVTVTKPAVLAAETIYKAYVVEGTSVVTSLDNLATGSDATSIKTDANGLKYVEIATGAAKSIKLKHGQKLVFNDLSVGATYVAVEKGVMGYIPSATLTVNGTVLTPDLTAADGQDLSTNSRLVGENKNAADYVNTFRDVTPTGLIINNLPFVMILAAAALAFIGFVAVKSRRRTSAN